MEIQKQLQILEQTHLRHLDRKNNHIKSLERDLEEAELQYANAIKAHNMNIDTLIDLQEKKLSSLKSAFDADTAALEEEFENERSVLA